MKERSKRQRCNKRNANGNLLDAAIIEQIKALTEHDSSFLTQLDKSRQFYIGNREQYETQLANLRTELSENEKKVAGLVDALSGMGESVARVHVTKRIEELSEINRDIENWIHELEGLTSANSLSDMEFGLLRQMLSMFRTNIDEMSVEEKRAAIRTVVRKVMWDGVNTHVVLFGAEEGEIESPDMVSRYMNTEEVSTEEESLEAYLDVDYGEFDDESPDDSSKTPWREDSKCYPLPNDFNARQGPEDTAILRVDFAAERFSTKKYPVRK